MDYLALPPALSVGGTLAVPPSKSATNRALLCAALTETRVEILHPLESEDTAALRRCLTAMGASMETTAQGLAVSGPLRGDPAREIVLDVADSGTAARFLTAVAAAVPGRFLVTGSPRLCQRPIGELVAALASAGARIVDRGSAGCLPISVEGGALRSGTITVDASRSSQFLSAILLAGVAVEGGLSVRASGSVASAPYVTMTLETLRELGHEALEGELLRVARGKTVRTPFRTPGDYSSAIPLLACAGAAGGEVTLTGLRWPSTDADAGALPVLQSLGVRIEATASQVRASAERNDLRPVTVRAADFPDAVPALAALAALAPGQSRFTGIAHLRLKESDRLAALASLLSLSGATAVAEEDGLTVTGPARPADGVVRLPSFRDHRMAMAAAILALRLPGILVEDPGCVAKSYPHFFSDLETIVTRQARGEPDSRQ